MISCLILVFNDCSLNRSQRSQSLQNLRDSSSLGGDTLRRYFKETPSFYYLGIPVSKKIQYRINTILYPGISPLIQISRISRKILKPLKPAAGIFFLVLWIFYGEKTLNREFKQMVHVFVFAENDCKNI